MRLSRQVGLSFRAILPKGVRKIRHTLSSSSPTTSLTDYVSLQAQALAKQLQTMQAENALLVERLGHARALLDFWDAQVGNSGCTDGHTCTPVSGMMRSLCRNPSAQRKDYLKKGLILSRRWSYSIWRVQLYYEYTYLQGGSPYINLARHWMARIMLSHSVKKYGLPPEKYPSPPPHLFRSWRQAIKYSRPILLRFPNDTKSNKQWINPILKWTLVQRFNILSRLRFGLQPRNSIRMHTTDVTSDFHPCTNYPLLCNNPLVTEQAVFASKEGASELKYKRPARQKCSWT
jgi:hypothetical protein